ncbi:hypothetical protein [Lacticaseibacillus sp. GG6-2]
MSRRKHQRRTRHWGRHLIITVLLLAIIIGAGAVFFPQLNNTWRRANGGNDTPADTAVKSTLTSQLEKQKNGNANVDAAIDTATTAIKNTKMSTLMAAAKNQSDAVAALQQAGLSSTQASIAANAVYSNSALDSARQKLAAGDYYGAYQAAKTVAQNGDLSQLESTIGQYAQ